MSGKYFSKPADYPFEVAVYLLLPTKLARSTDTFVICVRTYVKPNALFSCLTLIEHPLVATFAVHRHRLKYVNTVVRMIFFNEMPT